MMKTYGAWDIKKLTDEELEKYKWNCWFWYSIAISEMKGRGLIPLKKTTKN